MDGVCIWLTGRSGAGKSTITDALVPLIERTGRTITILDVVPQLGKAPGERTSRGKLERKAFVAGEIVRHGGVVICVTVSARPEYREQARSQIGDARFVEVHVAAPPAVSERRRNRRSGRRSIIKRVKRRARRTRSVGRSPESTPNEWEATADLVVDAVQRSPEENAAIVYRHLVERELLAPHRDAVS